MTTDNDDMQTLEPTSEVVRIGRAEDNDVVVDDSFVSGYHVELRRLASGWDVRDLGSSNGTILNGVQIHAAIARFGDTLSIGDTELALDADGPRLLSSPTPRDAGVFKLPDGPIQVDLPGHPSLLADGSAALADGGSESIQGDTQSMASPVANLPRRGRSAMGSPTVLFAGGILALLSGFLAFGNRAGIDTPPTVEALSLPAGCVWEELDVPYPYSRWSAYMTGSMENASNLQVDNVAMVAEILRDGQVIAIEDLAPFNVPAQPSGRFGVPLDRDWPIDPSTDTCRLTLTEDGTQPASGWIGPKASVGESGTGIPSEVGPGECDEFGFCAPPEGVPNDGRGGRTDEELEAWIGSRDYMCEVYGPDSRECNTPPFFQTFVEDWQRVLPGDQQVMCASYASDPLSPVIQMTLDRYSTMAPEREWVVNAWNFVCFGY